LDPEKDVTVLQIGNSGARITAILTGVVDGTIMAADFVPKAKREGFNVLADLADTKIEYPFLSLHMMGSYIDRNLRFGQGIGPRACANRFAHCKPIPRMPKLQFAPL
jgi:hypothetical protein